MDDLALGSIVNLLQCTGEGAEGWMIAQQDAPQKAAHNMASLIEELQALALNSGVPVSDLLLKAKVVAEKLDIQQLKEFCDRELNGYRQDDQFPEYRKVPGELQAYNSWHDRWQPIIFPQPEKVESLLGPRIVTTPVGELEGAHEAAEFPFDLDPTVKAHLVTAVGYPADVRCLLHRSQVLGIPRHVRNLILDWSLRLERAGIRGDGLSFSQPEKEQAHRISINIHGNVGNLSNVVDVAAGSTVTTRQTSTVGIDAESLSKLAAELRQYADALIAPDRRQQFRQALDAIESESQAENPDSGRLRQALTFVQGMVRDAAVSAGSGILVQGALALITDVLGRLG